MKQTTSTVTELLLESRTAVDSAFARIDWLESRIRHYSETYPNRKAYLFDTFKYGHLGVPPALWENHHGWCLHTETLIRRVAKKQNVQHPTHADMLFIISHHISKAIPLHGAPRSLYFWLFQDVFPIQAQELNIQAPSELSHELKPYYNELARQIIPSRPLPRPERYYEAFGEEAIEKTTTKSVQLKLPLD